jgi:hypothetical protein
MNTEHYATVGVLTLVLLLGVGFGLDPLRMWTDLLEHFGRGLDHPGMRSRIDRQRDFVALLCFVIFIGIPSAILLWFLYAD